MPNLATFTEDGYTYYELYITCPVCFNRGILRPQNFWTHDSSECNGGRIYVGDNAHYYCKECKKHSHVSNWNHRCPGHSKTVGFETLSMSRVEIPQVVGLAAQAAGTAGSAWLKRFLENLDED